MNKDFDLKFSFWNYVPLSPSSKEMVREWKTLGMNMAMSHVYDPANCKKEDMIALLDECQKEGIQVLVYDLRTSFHTFIQMGEEAFKEGVKEAAEDFGHHPAVYGFCLGDEPNFEQVDAFIQTSLIVQAIMPWLTPFGNLIPYFGDNETQALLGRSEEFYRSLVNRIVKEGRMPSLGYDHYVQCYDEDMDQKKGIKEFLYGLRQYGKIARENDIPLYVSLLSVRHWFYREPTFDDFRWQLSMSLAHGARGFFWFFLQEGVLEHGFGEPPFAGPNHRKTPLYDRLMGAQERFQRETLPLFNDLRYEDCLYFGDGMERSVKMMGMEIKAERNQLSVLSIFTAKDGQMVAMLVNGDQRKANLYRVKKQDGSQMDCYLLPGELRLFHLLEKGGLSNE